MNRCRKMLTVAVVLTSLMVPAREIVSESIWGAENLIGDKVFEVHDLISIVIKEQNQAATKDDTTIRRDSNKDLDLLDFFGARGRAFTQGSNNADSAIHYRYRSDATKSGEIKHKESFTARITARIVEVLPNGNLVFEARKTIRIGEEESTLIFSGEVRPQDVNDDNTIQSDNVADARLEYRGKGETADAVKRSWIGKLFDYTNIF